MCNDPPLCVPHCRDYHAVLEFVREHKAKRDKRIIRQVSSRESQLLSAMVVCDSAETLPPAVPHICHSLLRKHNIFSLRRTYGNTSVEWPTMLLLLLSCWLPNSPFKTVYLDVCCRTPSCKKSSETVSRAQAVCILPALWTVNPEDCCCLMLLNRSVELAASELLHFVQIWKMQTTSE